MNDIERVKETFAEFNHRHGHNHHNVKEFVALCSAVHDLPEGGLVLSAEQALTLKELLDFVIADPLSPVGTTERTQQLKKGVYGE